MTIKPNTTSECQVLLIDLDNCPRQIEKLPQSLVEFSRVVACYGGSEPKVPLKLVPLLSTAINDGKLEIIGMQKKGKNAADFGIAFLAGRLMAEMPADTSFLILSQDTDLDHVVNMLQSANRKAVRVDGKISSRNEESNISVKLQDGSIIDAVEEYYLHHLQAGKPRPRKKKTLQNSIKSFFKKRKHIKPDEILRGLVDHKFITIDDQGRVIYSDKK